VLIDKICYQVPSQAVTEIVDYKPKTHCPHLQCSFTAVLSLCSVW